MAHVEMYSIEKCPYCVNAKALLKEKGVDFIDHDISHLPDAELNAKMMGLTDRKTVPQIWINGEHIGGYDELKALDDAGELEPKLGVAHAGHDSGHQWAVMGGSNQAGRGCRLRCAVSPRGGVPSTGH